jgi:hypothetical protein
MPAAGPADGSAATEAAVGVSPGCTHGVELPIPPDGPMVRVVDLEIVLEQFYLHTPAEGTPEEKSMRECGKAKVRQISRVQNRTN